MSELQVTQERALRRVVHNYVGFFSDLHPWFDAATCSIDESIAEPGGYDREKVAAYLHSGTMVAPIMLVVPDPRVPSETAGTASVISDGVWAWPEYLEYFVRRYGVRLDSAFLAHGEERGWQSPDGVPTADEIELSIRAQGRVIT